MKLSFCIVSALCFIASLALMVAKLATGAGGFAALALCAMLVSLLGLFFADHLQ